MLWVSQHFMERPHTRSPARSTFIPADVDKDLGLKGGVDLNNDGVVSGEELVPITMGWFKKMVDGVDGDMKIWTVFMNTHCAWCVAHAWRAARLRACLGGHGMCSGGNGDGWCRATVAVTGMRSAHCSLAVS